MFKHYLTHIHGVVDSTGLEIGTVSREGSLECYLHPCNSKPGEQMIILPAKNRVKDEILKMIQMHPAILESDKDVYAVPIKVLYPTLKIKFNGSIVNLAAEEDFDYSELILKKE